MSGFKYRVRYTRKGNTSEIPLTEDVVGVGALSALNVFHRTMQLQSKMSNDKKTVLRPKLAPSDYSIVSIAILYNTDPSGWNKGETVESPFDLPVGSKNPDLRRVQPLNEENMMAFMATVGDGRLAQ